MGPGPTPQWAQGLSPNGPKAYASMGPGSASHFPDTKSASNPTSPLG